MNAFRLENVSFDYGGIVALEDVNLEITEEGAVILGANGSGKSTLLLLLDCLLFPQRGRLTFLGREVSEATLSDSAFSKNFRSKVGFMFQNPDVQLFCATVREEVAFGPLQLGFSFEEIERRVTETLRLCGIEHLADRSPFMLSGGEKKKVALASILSINPQMLLLDEPTSNLDPRTTAWLADLLVELEARGKTIIMATHDLKIAEFVSKKAIIMGEDHRVMAQGETEEILSSRKILQEANLIHEHAHAHGEWVHVHGHGHFADHVHEHEHKMEKDFLKAELQNRIADCLAHTHEMRSIARGIQEERIAQDIDEMEALLERMVKKINRNPFK